MAKKNESMGEKALRYGKAFLLGGGAWGVGNEALNDYREQKEEQAWEESALSQMENAFDSEQYDEAIKIANELLDNSDSDEDIQRRAKWIRAVSYSCYADELVDSEFSWKDEENKDAFDVIQQAQNLFYDYGNEYGWEDNVLFQVMLIENDLDYIVDARNTAIDLINSDDDEIRTTAIRIYESITDNLLSSDESFCDTVNYVKRKFIYLGRDIRSIAGTYQIIDKGHF